MSHETCTTEKGMNRLYPSNLENWLSSNYISRDLSNENSRILLSSLSLPSLSEILHEYFSEIHVGDVSGHVESHSNSGSSGVNESPLCVENTTRVSHFTTRRLFPGETAAGWNPRAKIGPRVDACAFCRGREPANFASRRASSFAGFMLMPRRCCASVFAHAWASPLVGRQFICMNFGPDESGLREHVLSLSLFLSEWISVKFRKRRSNFLRGYSSYIIQRYRRADTSLYDALRCHNLPRVRTWRSTT